MITDLAVRTDAVVERETKPSSLSITTHLLSEHGTELDAGTVRALLDSYGWADNPMAAIRRDVERGDIYAKIDKARAKAGLLAHMTADAQQEEQKRAEKAEHERLTAIRAEYVSQLTEEQRRLVCRWGRSAWSDLGGTCCEIAVVPYSMLNMDAGYCAAHAPEIERQRAEATAKVASGKTRREQVQAEFNRKLANFDGDLHEHLARPETG